MAGGASASSPVDICNLALGKLGAALITSITGGDTSAEAAACANVYYDMTDECLCECPWSFAQKMLNLNQLTGVPPWGNLGIIYATPADCLKVNYKSWRFATVKVMGQQIYSDTSNLGIKYTFRNYVVPTYFPLFKTALAARIAAEIAFSITNSAKKASDLMDEYTEIRLPAAVSSDSQQGTPDHARADEWENARLVGYPALAGQTSWGVWYPVG